MVLAIRGYNPPTMKAFLLSLTAVALAGFLSAPALLQEKGGDDRTGPYDVVATWPQLLAYARPGYIWGSTGGVFDGPDAGR